ncbi:MULTISPECIES: hypothetical protein [Streptomyces]|uniref:hypothetical protein n=1 Tax=Streptomyces TaxID=1883 RepID=UPI00103B5B1F|nr:MULTISPECIES: hypothetical protein [Streptomyces]MBT3074447.1 hypothetical protein [Streptomyces sp. COG21]MBT3083030.1 hypothetical protein [Streptomyces sp. COG20]MBT3085914.1 hypothetical protein [Streptomyces sp. CYG21]MBT3096639.1 hypothetical protein [Streptomyces sp. CBG30]MBT3105224.1 hypothetical protein [Streptomyces sp. COG19]
MDTPQNTALMRALAEVPGPLPTSGVVHITLPHTERFTVVGNHLAQNAALSTAAVGFAVRIQSLPQGTEVGIKALAARFPEGEKLIADALRELEAHGYLHRTRVRLPNGRMVTRTVFCNHPEALLRPRPADASKRGPDLVAAPVAVSVPAHIPAPAPAPAAPHVTAPVTPHVPVPETHKAPAPSPVTRQSATDHRPVPTPRLVPPPTAPKAPPRPLPQPRELTPGLQQAAVALLSDLRRHAPELVLSEADIERLTPATATWLERDTHPDTIRQALTTDLPQPVKYPAKFVRHRLTVLLPPPLPGAEELTPARPRTVVIPLQTCEGCERAFRSRTPSLCRDCRTACEQPAA